MRYHNWDVLVFPDVSKIPLQEFKTACQVIQDPEFHQSQNNPLLLPTVTCFIPGLPAGAPFRISIHCWQDPEISRYIQAMSKHADDVVFEARVFIDGRVASSKLFNRDGPWPTVIATSIELDKQGEFEKLSFPNFHRELLSQNYWNPGDDLGRIKVVITEGFPRDNVSMPFERVKNLVSFSFQHAPLDVLEASSIAWPNAAMWRQVSLITPYFSQQTSPRQVRDCIEAHSHSPRHGAASTRPPVPAPIIGTMLPPNVPIFPRQTTFDPFTETAHAAFNVWRQPSSADVSMRDYSTSSTRASSSRHVTDPMLISERPDRRFESMQSAGAFESICEALLPSTPVNTPQNADDSPMTTAAVRKLATKVATDSSPVKGDLETDVNVATLLSTSAMSNVRSRKENIQDSPLGLELNSDGTVAATRKVSQTFATTNNSGTKRQRVVTPAASKVIDDEDEPRTSPPLSKISRGTAKHEARDGGRRALGGIENV